jgi:hypothetical protein
MGDLRSEIRAAFDREQALHPSAASLRRSVVGGHALWQYSGPLAIRNYMAQPGGRDFAVDLEKPMVVDPLTDIVIIHADGTATDFSRRYATAW